MYVSTRDNKTHAIIENGASVYSGADGGFNMKAEEASFVVNLAQSGSFGGDYVLAGSVTTSIQHSDTLVHLGNTARVTGRDVRLYAGDLTTNVDWAGGIASGESLGVGFSLAINEFDRKTRAIIGDPDGMAPVGGPSATENFIDVTDKLDVLAKQEGDLWVFSISGAAAGVGADSGSFAIAGVAAGSFNRIDSETVAAVRSGSIRNANGLFVTATDTAQIIAVSGGGALAVKADSGTSIAVAVGLALAHNTIDNDVTASITDSVVHGGDVIVSASDEGVTTAAAVAVAVSVGIALPVGAALAGGGT